LDAEVVAVADVLVPRVQVPRCVRRQTHAHSSSNVVRPLGKYLCIQISHGAKVATVEHVADEPRMTTLASACEWHPEPTARQKRIKPCRWHTRARGRYTGQRACTHTAHRSAVPSKPSFLSRPGTGTIPVVRTIP